MTTQTSRPVSLYKCQCPITTTHRHTDECDTAWDTYTSALQDWDAQRDAEQAASADSSSGARYAIVADGHDRTESTWVLGWYFTRQEAMGALHAANASAEMLGAQGRWHFEREN